MVTGTDTTQVVSKAYMTRFIVKCGVLFTAGLLLTGILLFFSAHQPLGLTYQESFSRLAQLRHEMLLKSMLIYCILMVLIIAGVTFFSVLYSHRVVGPTVGLLRIIKLLAVGDFTSFAHLRTKDAIKPMADTLNTMITTYREKIAALQTNSRNMQRLVSETDSADLPGALRQELKAIDSTISTLNL